MRRRIHCTLSMGTRSESTSQSYEEEDTSYEEEDTSYLVDRNKK